MIEGQQLSIFDTEFKKKLDKDNEEESSLVTDRQTDRQYIYTRQNRVPNIHFINGDFRESLDYIKHLPNVVIVTDPPFNIGYHYGEYKDKMDDDEYYKMLSELINTFSCVFVHYPEALHRLSIECGITPNRVVSWVYNSNTAMQHRDIAFYKIEPDFKSVKQPYKNLNDKRIQERISRGLIGGRLYDWWNVNQVKNVSKDKTNHPCQMPLEIMKNIIATLPQNSTIVDTFMGSGTTAQACIDLGYDFVGIEIDKKFFEIAKKRIEAE